MAGDTMVELAERAAEAMAALGSCREGTWKQRFAALKEAGERCDSGFDEVFGWIADDEG